MWQQERSRKGECAHIDHDSAILGGTARYMRTTLRIVKPVAKSFEAQYYLWMLSGHHELVQTKKKRDYPGNSDVTSN